MSVIPSSDIVVALSLVVVRNVAGKVLRPHAAVETASIGTGTLLLL